MYIWRENASTRVDSVCTCGELEMMTRYARPRTFISTPAPNAVGWGFGQSDTELRRNKK